MCGLLRPAGRRRCTRRARSGRRRPRRDTRSSRHVERRSNSRGRALMTALRQDSMMFREIHEQPETIAATVETLLPRRAELKRLARDCRSVTLFARGSSDTAAVYGRYLLEIRANMPAALGAPSVATVYHATPDLRGAVVVMLSQSGRTTELVEVAAWARTCGARTIAIPNDGGSPLADPSTSRSSPPPARSWRCPQPRRTPRSWRPWPCSARHCAMTPAN